MLFRSIPMHTYATLACSASSTSWDFHGMHRYGIMKKGREIRSLVFFFLAQNLISFGFLFMLGLVFLLLYQMIELSIMYNTC